MLFEGQMKVRLLCVTHGWSSVLATHLSPDERLLWHSTVGNSEPGGSHALAVVVKVVDVLEMVIEVVIEDVDVVEVIVVLVAVVDVPLMVVVTELLDVEELVVVSVVVKVDVKEVVVTSHIRQPEQRAHVHLADHSMSLVSQVVKQLCGGNVDAPTVVVGGRMSGVPVGTSSVVVVVKVSVGSGGGVYSSSSGSPEGGSVLVLPKLKLYTTGALVVGETTLAHASQVAHTDQPHFTNQGCEFGKQMSWHWRGWYVTVVVVISAVVVIVVDVREVVVVVVQSMGGTTSGVNRSGWMQTPARYCSSSSACCARTSSL